MYPCVPINFLKCHFGCSLVFFFAYFHPHCGFGFFNKSDFSAIFFSHFVSSADSFPKFSRSRLQINANAACSGSLSGLSYEDIFAWSMAMIPSTSPTCGTMIVGAQQSLLTRRNIFSAGMMTSAR